MAQGCHRLLDGTCQGQIRVGASRSAPLAERVIPKCATDRSLAIAHGLDETFWGPDPKKEGKFHPKTVAESEINRLVAERTSPAVKAALESLATQPGHTPARRGRKS